MSEYQFYEFRTIDKPLSAAAQKEIDSWSSRTVASNTGAVFTYNYGSFPKDTDKVFAQYFDAMFHISNWGTTRLMFKFPANLVNITELEKYCISEEIRLITKPDIVILDICVEDDENGVWIEGDNWLSSLIQLRKDILSGDYRCLYLLWLKVTIEDVLKENDNIDPDIKEPPVPDNLKSLNGALADFIKIFDINPHIVSIAASSNSNSYSAQINAADHGVYINRLSDNEKNEFLLMLLSDEPLLSIKFKNRLKDFVSPGAKEQNTQASRTVRELTWIVQDAKKKKKLEEQRKKEEGRLAKLKNTEHQQEYLWKKIYTLIKEKNAKAYDECINLLRDLKELAIHKKQLDDFNQKVEIIVHEYSKLSGLKSRINEYILKKK